MSKRLGRAAALVVVSLLVGARAGDAQTRDDRIRQAIQAYDAFESARALGLLRTAMNPAEGPQDSLWGHGAQLLTQILTEEDRRAEAEIWARWAVRLAPTMRVDSVTFLPDVVAAFRSARQAVGQGSPGDAVTQSSWTWSAPGAGQGQGMLRVESPAMPVPVRVLVSGRVIQSGQSAALAAGTYDLQVAAEGHLAALVRREVLPGITTVLSFRLAPVVAAAPAAAPAVLSDEARAAVARQIVPLSVRRFGVEASCAAGAFVSRDGLVVTTYQAIRGAQAIDVELGGRRVGEDVRVAAYDIQRDVAVLQIPFLRTDSLAGGGEPGIGQSVWVFGLRDCRTATDFGASIAGTAGAGGSLQLRDSLPSAPLGAAVVAANGALLGVVASAGTAVPARTLTVVIDNARRAAGGQLQTVAQVALRENHAYGSVAITADVTGATARISPLESWQWPAVARSGALPLTFAGPMGRYQLAVEAPGQPARQQEFTIQPAAAQRVAVALRPVAAEVPQIQVPPRRGGGFPVPLAIGGAAGLGALAFLLLAGGGDDGGNGNGNGPTTGGIRISFPNP